jgi:hypothetical protein
VLLKRKAILALYRNSRMRLFVGKIGLPYFLLSSQESPGTQPEHAKEKKDAVFFHSFFRPFADKDTIKRPLKASESPMRRHDFSGMTSILSITSFQQAGAFSHFHKLRYSFGKNVRAVPSKRDQAPITINNFFIFYPPCSHRIGTYYQEHINGCIMKLHKGHVFDGNSS